MTVTLVSNKPDLILTIGHSTRPWDVFRDLLMANRVALLIDVRKLPGSRRHPQFDQQFLQEQLPQAGIAYHHMPGLGGRRKGLADSPNRGWRNASFRAYADYMLTLEFTTNLQNFLQLATENRAALMCAEAVPWQCHRSLIADALTAKGIPVEHIIGPESRRPHKLVPWAKLEDGRVTYPGETEDLFDLKK